MEKDEMEKVAALYFEDCELRRRLSALTLRAYRTDLRQYFDFMGQDWEDHKKISDYVHDLNQKYEKHKTVKRKIASVKAFYAYLEYEEYIESSPFHRIRTQIKEPKLLPKVISTKVINDILQYMYVQIDHAKSEFQKKMAVRNAAIIELLFATGIRISELCNLHPDDIDLDEGTLKIFGKGSKERNLYIGNDEVTHILKQYHELYADTIAETDFFFISKFDTRLSDQAVRVLLNHIEKQLNLSIHITPHMFRHTFATALLEKDVDIRYIQKILGHSSISITQIYTHVSSTKQKEILYTKNPRNDYMPVHKS